MHAANRIVAALGALALVALVAGCGGDGGGGEKAGGPPKAKEPLAAAAKRLEATVPGKDCKALAPLMLHSIPWHDEYDPPTAGACKYIRYESASQLNGLKVTKSRDFGQAGMTEGTGTHARSGEVVGVVWALDSDGSWKSIFNAVFRPQIGFSHQLGVPFDQNAQRFVRALATDDCDEAWLVLNAASRFVRRGKATYCKELDVAYRDKRSAYAQIKAQPDVRPREIGSLRDIGFYSLALENGRFMVIVLSGPLGGIATAAQQRQHVHPGVLELLTVRQPGS